MSTSQDSKYILGNASCKQEVCRSYEEGLYRGSTVSVSVAQYQKEALKNTGLAIDMGRYLLSL